jgi:hypothetical protein
MALTILQAILAVVLHNNQSMEEAFAFFAVNTRDGFTYQNGSVHKIDWIRGENTAPYYRIDKKGRLFVARKFENISSWAIDTNKVKNNLRVKPAMIQMNVLRASGKRGGYLIRLHVQTPILARTKKFQFHGKWVGYWASETMLQSGIWTKSANGKFGKATLINDVISYETVMKSVEMLNHALDKDRNTNLVIGANSMFGKSYTAEEWMNKSDLF